MPFVRDHAVEDRRAWSRRAAQYRGVGEDGLQPAGAKEHFEVLVGPVLTQAAYLTVEFGLPQVTAT